MVKHRVRGKHKSILDFISHPKEEAHVKRSSASATESVVDKESVVHENASVFQEQYSGGIDDILKSFVKIKREIRGPDVEKTVEEKEKKGVETEIKVDLSIIPSGKILDEILYKGLSEEDITCNSNGLCSDGRRIGEIFTDKYGFRRQRGFVNTTRLPVFLDWIVEEALVEEILPKTYVVKTNRGSLAVIPEDFLCELHTRYGVLLKNYDKCKSYKPVIGGETIRRKRR